MPSKTGKTYASYYKSDVAVEQSTNAGFDSTTRSIISGDGAKSSMSASDDVLQVQPQNDDTTGAMVVKNKGGSNILAVDTTNSKVLGGATQTALNTQYAYFGVDYKTVENLGSPWAADTHYAIPFSSSPYAVDAAISLGSSTSSSFNDTNPATSLTISSTAHSAVKTYWYVPDNITIDAVHWWHGADAATGEDVAAHLMGYDVVSDNSSNSGNLSNGTVLADAPNITNAGHEQIYYQSMTVQSADVDAGKVILFTFASDTVNSDYTINATVKYHIR